MKTCATSCSRVTSAVRPVALRLQGIERQGADGRLAPHREREAQVRLDAETAAVLPVNGGLRRQLLQRRNDDHAAGQHLLSDPRVVLLAQRLGQVEDRPGRSRRGWA